MKAAVLAIGTELTTGQIINRNASWISEKLKSHGMLTELHLTVPDERNLMLESMEFCSHHSELLFFTGGLGPTSDDFTRNVVGEWCKLPLEFDEASWQHLNERLSGRGYQVTEIQRQQCYFPKGARILKNSQGTANAFHLKRGTKNIYVLPGPPREIDAIWTDFIDADIIEFTRNLDRNQTLSWDTMGFGESQIAERIEKIVGVPSKFEIGYRVHLPYVEVKFSYLQSERPTAQPLIDQIDAALKDCTIVKNGEDILSMLMFGLSNFDRVEIYDDVTGGILNTRFLPLARKLKSWLMSSDRLQPKHLLDAKTVLLAIQKVSESEVVAYIRTSNVELEAKFSSQLNANMVERKLQIFTEKSLIFWMQELRSRK